MPSAVSVTSLPLWSASTSLRALSSLQVTSANCVVMRSTTTGPCASSCCTIVVTCESCCVDDASVLCVEDCCVPEMVELEVDGALIEVLTRELEDVPDAEPATESDWVLVLGGVLGALTSAPEVLIEPEALPLADPLKEPEPLRLPELLELERPGTVIRESEELDGDWLLALLDGAGDVEEEDEGDEIEDDDAEVSESVDLSLVELVLEVGCCCVEAEDEADCA